MPVPDTLLKPTEAAVVAGVSLRDVNRMIDEGVLPDDFLSTDGGRRVAPAACLLIAFYVDSAEHLTSKERRIVVDTLSARLRKHDIQLFASAAGDDWTVQHDFLAVDVKGFVRTVVERSARLAAAEKLVISSPEILSGTPIIKGTRIPVHDVAASVGAGIPRARILAAYPALTADQIDLAALYAEANPPRGRPRGPAPLPAGAHLIVNRRVVRRRKAG